MLHYRGFLVFFPAQQQL